MLQRAGTRFPSTPVARAISTFTTSQRSELDLVP